MADRRTWAYALRGDVRLESTTEKAGRTMVVRQKNKQPARRLIDYKARMISTMLQKLEANPSRRYEEVLTADEYNEAVQMIGAAVAHVQQHMAVQRSKGKREKPPSRFNWNGRSYPLWFSNLGRVFIANKNGVRLIGSGYGAI